MEIISVNIATFSQRHDVLKDCVDSLLHQTVPPTEINLYLNDGKMPGWIDKNTPTGTFNERYIDRVVPLYDDELGDLKDNGKFYELQKFRQGVYNDGFYLTCDDDLIYPIDYIEQFINEIEKTARKVIFSHHGNFFNQLPIERYYWQNNLPPTEKISYECLHECKGGTVHMVGTGCTGWHTSCFSLSLEDFPFTMMADILFSTAAYRKGIEMRVLPHPAGYLVYNPNMGDRWTICEEFDRGGNDKIQVNLINNTYRD